LKPGGRYLATDLSKAGGVRIPLNALFDCGYLQHGRMAAENLESVT
jgi:hypothetical protein